MTLIEGKVGPPREGEHLVPRPRLGDLIRRLTATHRVVWVTATPGAGKTTAVYEALVGTGTPLAWLTADTMDRAPGRLLTYLEAALERALPTLGTAGTDSLAQGASHLEAAGVLAESVGHAPVTLVVDEVERVTESPAARAVLGAFLRYAPDSLRAVLISRRPVPPDLRMPPGEGNAASVGEQDLAFTTEEAEHALHLLGRSAEAGPAVQATGGWVTGVLFGAWRSPQHVHGVGGEADPLSGYLSSEVMGQLPEAEAGFLVETSVLDAVTPQNAEALGIAQAGRIMASLRSYHLPVVFSPNGFVLHPHPRFREYLQQLLDERNPAEVRRIRRAHGDLLTVQHRYEDAVEEYLRAGDGPLASAVEHAVLPVLRRLDFDVAERWLDALDPMAIRRSETLTYAQLLIAVEREEYSRGCEIADRLVVIIAPPRQLDPEIAGIVAWCLFLACRVDDAKAVLDRAEPGPQTDTMRFCVGVELLDDAMHYRDRPPDSGGPLDGFLARVDLAHGRFDRILASTARPWAAVRSSRVGALQALGRLNEALALTDDTPGWTNLRLYVELMADFDRPEEAWASLNGGRERLVRTGSGLYRMFALLLEAALALRFRHDTPLAAAALKAAEREPTALNRVRIVEQLELWRGLIGLLDGDDEAAVTHLRRATGIMTEWDRWLFLPAAAVYLAEACWRIGDEEAADHAADLALQAAGRQTSNHLLLQALRQFPAVLSRRLDAESGNDSPWHALGRVLLAEGVVWVPALHPRVRVREFGSVAVFADGEERTPRLAKSAELLAYLAANGNYARRDELLGALFSGRNDDSGRAYLRMAVSRLRQVLPEDAPLVVYADGIGWTGSTLTSDSVELQSELQQLAHLRGRPHLEASLEALRPFERGEYFPHVRSRWVDERRAQLAIMALDTRAGAASSAFTVGEYRLADELVRQVLEQDPYRESAWRLAMRIASALGDDDRVISTFRLCEKSLAEVPAQPAASTRQLLEQLRR